MITKIVMTDNSEFTLNRALPFGVDNRNKPRIVSMVDLSDGLIGVKCDDGSLVRIYPFGIRYVELAADNKEQPALPDPPKAVVESDEPVKLPSRKILTPPRPGPQAKGRK